MVPRKAARPGGLTLLLAVMALHSLAWAPPARAGATCTFNPTTHAATVVADVDVSIVRSGDNVLVNLQACGTVSTLDSMKITLTDQRDVDFDLSGGPLGPGHDNEDDGSSEIEFLIETLSVAHTATAVAIKGTGGDDLVHLGQKFVRPQLATAQVVNLNAGEDLNGPVDDDVVIVGPLNAIVITGYFGADVVSGAGTGDRLTSAAGVPLYISDGPGADVVTGGATNDLFLPEDGPDEGDTWRGGGGRDDLWYFFRSENISVTQNGVADDGVACPGVACEGDNVADDIETVRTGEGDDRLVGGSGSQWLFGGPGDNQIVGGDGDDSLFAEGGTDVIRGGRGFDTAGRISKPDDPGVRMSLDGKPNDGLRGEGDNIHQDVERLVGTDGSDTLIGSDVANELDGRGGADLLKGMGGRDVLVGGWLGQSGDDMFGGAGVDTVTIFAPPTTNVLVSLDDQANDRIAQESSVSSNIHSDIENVVGTPYPDTLRGSNVANRLIGVEGNDVLRGLRGNDRLSGGAGDDNFEGGSGTDTCEQGPGIGTKQGCER